MPIGTGIIYNVGDLILSQVSGSGTSFLETKIAAATSSIVYFDSTARINSASLNSITVGTASYVSGSTSIITNLTASNISASGTSSFGMVGIGTSSPEAILQVANTGRILGVLRLQITPQTTFYDHTFAIGTDGGGAQGFIYTSGTGGTFPLNTYGELILQAGPRTGFNNGISLVTGTTSPSVKLRIAEDGNVGIGTTSPGALLEISSSTAASLLNVKGVGGNGILFVSGSGFVGIGTSSPTVKLDVNGAINTNTFMYVSYPYGNAYPLQISANNFLKADDYYYGMLIRSGDVNYISGKFQINGGSNKRVEVSGYEETIGYLPVVIPGGNVGIGTTVPAYLLDVSGSSRHGYRAADTHQFTGSVSVSGSVTAASFTGSLSGSITSALTASYLTPANSYTITNLTASNISASLTGSFGMVGIGTTAPGELLDIAASADNSAVAGPKVNFKKGATTKAVIGIGGNYLGQATQTDDLIFRNDAGNILFGFSGAEKMRIASGGNIGIGTTSPGALLEVSSSTAASLLNIKGAGGNAILFVSGSGNVGIGTTTIGEKLTVSGSSYIVGGTGAVGTGLAYYLGDSTTRDLAITRVGAAAMAIGRYSPSSWVETIRFTADGNVGIGTTLPSASLSIQSNGNQLRLQTTTGPGAYFSTIDSRYDSTHPFQLAVANNSSTATEFFGIYADSGGANNRIALLNGNVGIGTTTASAKLHVAGNISGSSFTSSISNAVGFLGTSSWAQNVVSASFATTAQTANALNTANSYTVGSLTSTTQIGGTTGTIRSQITPGIYSNGLSTGNAIAITSNTTFANQGAWANLGLHQTTANANDLTAKVYLAIGGWYQNSGTGLPVYIGGGYTSNSSSVLSVVPVDTAGNGNVGIGTTAPAAKLEITGSSNSVLLNIKSPISGAILYVSGSGAVGIGTSNVGAYTLQVSGSFAATTKSFVIEHPTKAGKKLIYGSLESPYHGIRLTGRDTLKEGKCKIQLPDYIYKLILHDSVNIQLTGIKCNKTLYIDDINVPENYFTIAYDKAIFESYKDYEFFWDFTAIRADVPELQTEM